MSIRSIKITNSRLLAFLIKVFIVVNLMFPYVNKISYRNCTFILSNFIAVLISLLLILKKNVNTNKSILKYAVILLVFYNLFAFVNNFNYSHYYIEQINKNISYIFFILLIMKVDEKFIFEYKIVQFLLISIFITLSASIIYRAIGGDAVWIENMGISFTKQGAFEDNRLTWIFGHKSTYALLVLLFSSIGLKYKNLFEKKFYYISFMCICVLVSNLIDSATLIILMFLLFFSYYIKKFSTKKYKILAILIVPFITICSSILFKMTLNSIGKERDLSSFGSRTYIYEAAINNIPYFPNGVGKDFGNIFVDAKIVMVENFHNIFFNEMFRFSVIVGILYFLIHILFGFWGVKKDIFSFVVVISCFVLFFMDFSLRTEQISIYLFLIFIVIYREDFSLKILEEET